MSMVKGYQIGANGFDAEGGKVRDNTSRTSMAGSDVDSDSFKTNVNNEDISTNKSDNNSDDDSGDDCDENSTYPADCYSFIALHSPLDGFKYFGFGFIVWVFQISFLLLMVFRVNHPRFSTNEQNDNPEEDSPFSPYIPANVPEVAKATQYFAIISYCIFADESVRDMVTAVETFPRFDRVKKEEDKLYCLIASSLMRLVQGGLAGYTVLLLVVNTSDVIEIVLNFTAVNFISGFDDSAFSLAKYGKYGTALKAEASRIENLPRPRCIKQLNDSIRARATIALLLLSLLASLTFVTVRQQCRLNWRSQSFRVQFAEDSFVSKYSGCFFVDDENSTDRSLYNSFSANKEFARIGYCEKHEHHKKYNHKWLLFIGSETSPCDVNEMDVLARSEITYDYDISSSFDSEWYTRTGTPIEMYFLSENDVVLDEEFCEAFIGDGYCNNALNEASYDFDGGDCCGSTCEQSWCGCSMMDDSFNTSVYHGDGFPKCKDPNQHPISIHINSLHLGDQDKFSAGEDFYTFLNAELAPHSPLLYIECDGLLMLRLRIETHMENGSETVMVADGADCTVYVKNTTSAANQIYFINYTIYHGGDGESNENPVILEADSFKNGVVQFQRIPNCFFTKLTNYVDTTTIYTGNEPQNKAIKWLLEDKDGYSTCEDKMFVERYALAVINFALPMDRALLNPAYLNETTDEKTRLTDSLWINNARQCAWRNIACIGGCVVEVDISSIELGDKISGSIPTEIGLLTKLEKIEMGCNNIYGQIPSEIGLWSSLKHIGLGTNRLTGKIPTEIGLMSNLTWFFAEVNSLTSTLPSEIGSMPSLQGLQLLSNKVIGTIPTEIGDIATPIRFFSVDGNNLSGTIPSELGRMKNISYLSMSENNLDGTIPSSLGSPDMLTWLDIQENNLTGNVPAEIIVNSASFINLNVYGNNLSNLLSVDGQVICKSGSNTTLDSSEHYCNCANDCLRDLDNGHAQRCQCSAAKHCCESYFEKNKIRNCVVCEAEFSNPDFIVPAFHFENCTAAAADIFGNLNEYGTTEQCNSIKKIFNKEGCICTSYIPF